MKKNTLGICIAAVFCCTVMAVVDGIIQPGYVVKSAVKVVLFLLVPLALGTVCKLSLAETLRPDKAALLAGGCLGLATFGVVMGAYALLGSYIDLSAVPEALAQNGGITRDNFLFVALYIALCNSLLEEFFFRSFAFMGLLKTGAKAFAYLFSAAAFAAYHAGMLIGMISVGLFVLALAALFACGLLFNFLDARRERIWVSWLVHMGANLAINTVGMNLLGMF